DLRRDREASPGSLRPAASAPRARFAPIEDPRDEEELRRDEPEADEHRQEPGARRHEEEDSREDEQKAHGDDEDTSIAASSSPSPVLMEVLESMPGRAISKRVPVGAELLPKAGSPIAR